jgi:hypothetical protein
MKIAQSTKVFDQSVYVCYGRDFFCFHLQKFQTKVSNPNERCDGIDYRCNLERGGKGMVTHRYY